MKRVLFALAAIIALAACGNKQAAAPETESSKVSNEVVTNDTISPEMKEANMKEVQAYLKECGAFFIATADEDQPRVRPFGVSEIIDGRLYIMTGKVKDVYKQMVKNGKGLFGYIRIEGIYRSDTVCQPLHFVEHNIANSAVRSFDVEQTQAIVCYSLLDILYVCQMNHCSYLL